MWGLIIYQNLLNEEERNMILQEAKKLTEATLNRDIPPNEIDDLTPPGMDDNGKTLLHRLPYFTKYSPQTKTIIESKNLLSLGRSLLNKQDAWFLEDTMHGSIFQTKTFNEGSKYKKIDWHIDFNDDHELSPVVSLGIYMDDSVIENGCLQVIPGSHNRPTTKYVPPSAPVEVKAGDMICHIGSIFHSSTTPIVSNGIRRTLYLYCCGGNYPGKGLPFSAEVKKYRIKKIFQS
ncbi:phytanoyl-CoA dioxygenase family protein [Bacillus nakamurai]|nr:phytanoyl-CoA dioxygenase family protein [Bacillus nakamurai]MED1227740.1 phytanoyl-CoA dioxygenase family protein [Bacillus nakamurai]